MKSIVKMEFGSIVYGTNTPSSDKDYKEIFIPDHRDIILGTTKDSLQVTTKLDKLAKNTEQDVDIEMYSVQKYLNLLSQGQTVATDMLFVPEKHIIEHTYEWAHIVSNKHKIINRNLSAFIGYSKTQANRYGIRGSRMAAVEGFINLIKDLPDNDRISDHITKLQDYLNNTEYCSITQNNDNILIEVCNAKVPVRDKVKRAKDLYVSIYNEYGNRSRQAKENQGIDWKSLGHAVRICEQGVELLDTGHVTFPRPNAKDLLKIRKGEYSYQEVATRIEEGLDKLESKIQTSSLPDKSDIDWINDTIYSIYSKQVVDNQPK